MFCSQCGKPASSEDRFCGGCGLILPFVRTASRPTPRGRGSLIIGICFAVLGVIVFGSALINLSRSNEVAPAISATVVSRQAGALPASAPVKTVQPEPPAVTENGTSAKPESQIPVATPEPTVFLRPTARLTELRGSLARQREYDLWLIRNVSDVINSAMAKESQQVRKIIVNCSMITAKQLLDSPPEFEYVLQTDGTVLRTPPRMTPPPPMTPEQRYRNGQRRLLEESSRWEESTQANRLYSECAGFYIWFGTWHDQPIPTDEKFGEILAKATADLEEIDKTLDPRLVESLPKPQSTMR